MKLAHPYYFHPISIDADFPMTLVIENPELFRQTISGIIEQCNGNDGDFVLSENDKVLELSKYCVLISDICRMDFMTKEIKTKVQKIIEEEIENEDETNILLSSIEQFASEVADNFKYPLKYKIALQSSDLIKFLNFEIDETDALPIEKIIDYMEIYTNLLGKKLIITVNMNDYLSSKEYVNFLNDIRNRQISLLMLERHTHSFDDSDHRVIIDQDLCEI